MGMESVAAAEPEATGAAELAGVLVVAELPPQADSAKVMAQARSRAKSLDCFFMVVIPPIYFLNMMLLCSTAFMYESDIVIIGVPSINVKGKIAVKAKNRQNRIVKVL